MAMRKRREGLLKEEFKEGESPVSDDKRQGTALEYARRVERERLAEEERVEGLRREAALRARRLRRMSVIVFSTAIAGSAFLGKNGV